MSQYIQLIAGLQVEVAKAATLPTPSDATGGATLTTSKKSWAPFSGAGYPKAAVALFADGAANVTNARLLGFGPFGDAGANVWVVIAPLNNGSQISLTSTVGYIQEIDLPAVFTRLAVDGTVSANNVGYTLTPISVRDS